jgi:hypothetical protein
MLEKSRDGFEQRTKPYCALERRLLPIMAASWVFAVGIGSERGS